jgi:hypothetical protein
MSDIIYLAPKQRASLRLPSFTAKFKTLQEAILHWRKHDPSLREHAVLILDDDRVFQPAEISLINAV